MEPAEMNTDAAFEISTFKWKLPYTMIWVYLFSSSVFICGFER